MKIIMLGPQGSGKGTYASRLSPILGIPHISTGDIFRDNIKEKTELGKKIEDYMHAGKLVPDEITMQIVKERLNKPDCENGFILDGFPRTLKQAADLGKITDIDYVVYLDVPEDILLKRLSSRVICKECGKIYNLLNIKPKEEGKCDVCEGELIRRKDETPEGIEKRLKEYEEKTKPIEDYYRKKGKLLIVSCNKFDSPPDVNVKKILDLLGVEK